jgi:hypothetical protein
MLRRFLVIGALFGLCCASVVMAGVPDYFDHAAKSSWKCEDDGLQLRLGITLYPQGLVRAFDAPERPAQPMLLETETIVPEQQFGVYVVFSGCAEDSDGNCNTTVVYEIELPDGTVAVRQDSLPVWRLPAPAADMPQLSEGVWVTSADPMDPAGAHVVRATVTDHVAGKTMVLERTLVLEHDVVSAARAQAYRSTRE